MCLTTSGRGQPKVGAAERKVGEPGRNRTYNQQIKSLLLCQLSYGPGWDVLGNARPAPLDVGLYRPRPTRTAGWRARQDSNLRPTDSKSGALSN